MFVLLRWIKHALDVSLQCPHDADARYPGRAIEFDYQEQGFDRGLPLVEILFGLRQAGDVVAGIARSHKLTPTRY